VLPAAVNIRLASHRHLYQQEIAERAWVDGHVSAVTEPVEGHCAHGHVMHSRTQRIAMQGESMGLEDRRNPCTRGVEVVRIEHQTAGVVKQGTCQRHHGRGSGGICGMSRSWRAGPALPLLPVDRHLDRTCAPRDSGGVSRLAQCAAADSLRTTIADSSRPQRPP
jgi:hypothetical protein